MNKPFKVFSSSVLVATLAATSLTPVATQAATPSSQEFVLESVIFMDGEKLAKLSMSTYTKELNFGTIKDQAVYVQYPSGEIVKLSDYTKEYTFSDGDLEKTFKALKDKKVNATEIFEGYIDENGKVRAKSDEQPEDRLNETFFYNVA